MGVFARHQHFTIVEIQYIFQQNKKIQTNLVDLEILIFIIFNIASFMVADAAVA